VIEALGPASLDQFDHYSPIWKTHYAKAIKLVSGNRAMHVIVNWSEYRTQLQRIPAIWEGGLVMYGGLLAIFFTVVGFAIKNKIRILRLCDLVAPSCFLGDSIGRWGCFFAGDDYGRPTDSWVGVTFTHPESLVPAHLRGVPLHPTQIYMSLKALIIFGALMWITRHKKFDGQVAGWSFILYAVIRSVIELFRGDLDRGFIGPLSTAQFTSIFPDWQRFGIQRHFNTMQPDDVARAVVTTVTAPPHMWIPVVEVQPWPPSS